MDTAVSVLNEWLNLYLSLYRRPNVFIFLAVIPALIACCKGRSFKLWWIYGVLLFPLALIHSLLLKPTENYPLD